MLQAREGLASPHDSDSHVTHLAPLQHSAAFRPSRSLSPAQCVNYLPMLPPCTSLNFACRPDSGDGAYSTTVTLCALSRAFAHGRDQLLLALRVTVRWECMLYCSSRRLQISRRRMPSGTNLMTGCLPSCFEFCYSPFQACRSAMLHSSLRARPVGSSLFFQHRKRLLPEGTGVSRTAPLFLAADW